MGSLALLPQSRKWAVSSASAAMRLSLHERSIMRYWPAEEAAQAMGACGPVVDEAVIECMFCFVLC